MDTKKEKIISIDDSCFRIRNSDYEGFVIKTSKQTIKVGISSYQQCCEDYGYLITEDDISKFVGSALMSIHRVDRFLGSIAVETLDDLDCGDAMFINFSTDVGLFQIVAYNAHNGYYGHDAVVISRELNIMECL